MARSQLRGITLFRDLNEGDLDELSNLSCAVAYPAGELVFQEGGPSIGLYVILSGLIQYGKLSGRRNRRRILKILGPGDTFGEEALFNSDVCACSGYARAITDASIASIERQAFRSLMEGHPVVARHLCEWLTGQLRVLECKLVELAYEPFEQNLLRLLVVLADRFGERAEAGLILEIKLSRQDLADLLGAHMDTVIRELSKLQQRGLIAFKEHHLVILDETQLRKLAEPQTTCLVEKLFG